MKVTMKLTVRPSGGGLVAPSRNAPGFAELKLDVEGGTPEALEKIAEVAGEAAERIAGAVGIEAVTRVTADPGR